jgi:ATP-dependent Clp protease adaptor protein ClpS
MANHEREHEDGGAALAPERPQLQPPRQFGVVFFNDDYTPMDFVVEVLLTVFSMTQAQAESLMLAVHTKGRAVAGSYTREIAETRVAQAMALAQANDHPFRCDLTPV